MEIAGFHVEAFDRKDKKPSAAICIDPNHESYGYYKDQGGEGAYLSFWDLASAMGKFSDWRQAQKHYGDKVGVPHPSVTSGKTISNHQRSEIIAEYDYVDEQGQQLYQVVKMEPKSFRQRCRKQDGSWNWSIKGIKRVPYRLEKIIQAANRIKSGYPVQTVYIVEGEKDVHSLEAIGLIATCNSGGAGKWDENFSKYFQNIPVVILPDNDDPGMEHAQKMAKSLLDIAKSIKVIELPGLPEKGDVSDWLAAGNTKSDLQLLVKESPEWGIEPIHKFISSEELYRTDFQTEYLVEGLLVKGQPGGIFGHKKCLKTNISIDLALSLACKHPFLGKFHVSKAVNVAVMSGESGAATIKETARRIAMSKGWSLDQVAKAFWSFDVPRIMDQSHLDDLKRFIKKNEIQVMILDPTYLMMSGLGGDAGNLFEVGKYLMPLTELSQETGCTLVICHHMRKKSNFMKSFDPPELEDISWSGFQEWVRQWILLSRRERFDPDKPGEHRLWFSYGGSAGHSGEWGLNISEGSKDDEGGRRWDVEVVSSSQARSEVIEEKELAKEDKKTKREKQDCEEILKVLKDSPDGDTTSKLSEKAGMSNARGTRALQLLLEKDQVQTCTIKRGNNQVYEGFQLSLGQHSDCPTESD